MRLPVVVLALLFSLTSFAEVHICKTPDGKTVFQDKPCSVSDSDASDECSHPISYFENRIQSGQGNYIDRRCLDRLQGEARIQARLEAQKAEQERRLAAEAAEKQRQEEKQKEWLAEEARRKDEQLRALQAAQAKLVEPDDPELTKAVLEKACLRHVLNTHAFKDPESVRVEGSELAWKVDDAIPRYVILVNVNAKNSWGAYTGAKPYQCFLSEDGLRLSDVQ